MQGDSPEIEKEGTNTMGNCLCRILDDDNAWIWILAAVVICCCCNNR